MSLENILLIPIKLGHIAREEAKSIKVVIQTMINHTNHPTGLLRIHLEYLNFGVFIKKLNQGNIFKLVT